MSSRPLLALAALILAACLPASAPAATTPGEGGAYFPQNGAELLEAVDAVAGGPDGLTQGRIVLADKTYVIDRTIVLLDQWGDDSIVAAQGAKPIITSAAGGFPLLRMRGENTRVDDITLIAPTTSATYALVQLEGRAQFRSNVEVPESAPNVTGILTLPTGKDDYSWTNTIQDVISEARNAPAVRVTGTARFDGFVLGGNPTVDIDLASSADEPTDIQFYGDLVGTTDTQTVLQVRANTRRLPLFTRFSTITALRPGATGIRVRGAAASTGSVDLHLWASTIDLVGGGTAIRVEPGAETTATTIEAIGLLALGAGTAVECATPGTAPNANVTIDAIYREADHAPTTACTIAEQRRVTGAPKFTDRDSGDLTPLWGSVLIDAAPSITEGISEYSTYTKPSRSFNGSPLPNDIGAGEYQYTRPDVDETITESLDNQGLVRMSVIAIDPDPTDQDSLQYEWTMDDGTKLTGATVVHRWATDPNSTPWVSVKVTDRTGEFIYDNVLPHPIVQPNQAYVAYHSDAYLYPFPGQPTPTPTQSAAGSGVNLGRPWPIRTPRPVATPKPPAPFISSLTITGRRASRKGKQRQSGIGRAKRGEAGATITLTGASKVNLRVGRVKGKNVKPVTVLGLTLPAGTTPLHFTTRFRSLKLPPGVYEITAAIGTRSVSAPVRIRISR